MYNPYNPSLAINDQRNKLSGGPLSMATPKAIGGSGPTALQKAGASVAGNVTGSALGTAMTPAITGALAATPLAPIAPFLGPAIGSAAGGLVSGSLLGGDKPVAEAPEFNGGELVQQQQQDSSTIPAGSTMQIGPLSNRNQFDQQEYMRRFGGYNYGV